MHLCFIEKLFVLIIGKYIYNILFMYRFMILVNGALSRVESLVDKATPNDKLYS